MASKSDHPASDFETENTGGFLAGFLAEDEEFDRPALLRLGTWGAASVGAVIAALIVSQSGNGLRREQVADLARQSQQIQSIAKENQNETRRLASAIDTLDSDRDRLFSRVGALEQGLESVTGAIARQAPAPPPQAATAVSAKADAKAETSVEPKIEPKIEAKAEPKTETKTDPKLPAQNPTPAPIVAPVAATPATPLAASSTAERQPSSPAPQAAAPPSVKAEAKIDPKVDARNEPKAEPKIEPKNDLKTDAKTEPQVVTPNPAPVAAAAAAPPSAVAVEKPATIAAPEPVPAAVASAAPANSNPPAATPAMSLMATKSLMAPPDSAAAKLTAPEPRRDAVTSSPMPEVMAAAPPSDDTAPDAAPAAIPKLQRTEFGADVGGANSLSGLRALWHGLVKSNKELANLRPIVVVKESGTGYGMQLRLVVGPLSDAAAAAKICAGLMEGKRPCQTTVFDGQSLAMKADEPPAAARPAPHRFGAKRAAAEDGSKKSEFSASAWLFGKR
jgi:hypothetical protein